MNRRDFLLRSTAAVAAGHWAQAAPPPSPLGVCIYSYGAARKFDDTLAFLDHCHALGAAGIQMPLTSLDRAFAEKVRAKAGEYGMYYEGIVSLPKADVSAFEQQLVAAKAAGASVVRSACLSGRRYETFHDLASWQQFTKDSHEALNRAIPLLEKHKIQLALENHKDWTVGEMMGLMKTHESEYLGVCLDFGNNLSLLDEPEAVLKLIPYALSTHVKDMAVEADREGFLMSEVPLGEGLLAIPKMVSAVRAAKPKIRFSVEMITRDPLPVPCLTDGYWVTFPDRNGIFLARTVAMVRTQSARLQPLPRISRETKDTQARLADDNVKSCLHFAREQFAS